MNLEPNKNIVGKNIKKFRKLNNISQEELAQKLFISRTAISKWESGLTEPNIEFLRKMSNIFNVDLNDLIKYENKKPETKIFPKKIEKEIVKKKVIDSRFVFDKAHYSGAPNNNRDSKLFYSILLGYISSSILFIGGFYLTIIVLIVFGHIEDPDNVYFFQILAGIPLMIVGIVIMVITLKRHLLFDLLKRQIMINSNVVIENSIIKVLSKGETFMLEKKNILSVNTYYEKLPISIWKSKSISPLVVELVFSDSKKLNFYELSEFVKIKNWIEGDTYE